MRTCDNHCEFCFIHQLPKGLRRSLYIKDDDYRLSFLYGNFTTLTRFTEADLERVVTEGLSPLWVSIHATDPQRPGPHAAQQAGRDQPALAAGAARPRHRGPRPGGGLPRCQRRAPCSTTPSPGSSTAYPELASGGLRPPRREPVQRRGGHARPTPGRGRRRGRGSGGGLAADLPDGPRAPPGVRGRRVLPARGPSLSPAGDLRDLAQHDNGVGMAAAFEARFSRRIQAPPPAARAASSSPSTAPLQLATGRPAPAGSVTLLPRRHAPVTVLTGTYGARGPRPLVAGLRRPRSRRTQRVLRRQHRRGRPADRRRSGPGPGRRARRTAVTCCPTCASPAGCSSTASSPDDLPRRSGGRSAPTPTSLREALAIVSDPSRRRGRPPERRQEHPRQPDRRRPRGHRRRAAGRHPGPQAARRRVGGRQLHGRRHRRVAGRRHALDRQVSAQAERAIAEADVVLLVVDTTVGVTEEDARVADLLRRSTSPPSWSPTRSTATAASPTPGPSAASASATRAW